MRYATEHKQETRTRVLNAAARAIRGAGPDRVAVAGVMAEAGLTHGGFYAHFESKSDLIAAAIAHMFEQSAKRMVGELGNRDPAEGLRAYIDFYLSQQHCAARSIGCPIAALASDLPRLDDASRIEFSRGVGQLVTLIAGMLAALGRAEPESLARSMIAELVGALSLARVEAKAKQAEAILVASRNQIINRLGLERYA